MLLTSQSPGYFRVSAFRRRMVKGSGAKSINSRRLKMKDLIGTCSYDQLYQSLKQYSKSSDCFFKELLAIFQQRADLELTYAKRLQKLAGKLIRACQGMSRNSTCTAWCHVSDEMYLRADAHRSLGNAFHQEAIVEIRQVQDEHNRRKRPLDGAIERNGKLFTTNWNEQIKLKKKLMGLTKEHESLFNYVEKNKHTSTEKEKQKMLNRLTRSAQQQGQVDEEYFNINMEGYQMRLKWQNTLKNCHQIVQELEKQRIEVLYNLLSRYNLHMASFSHTLKHGQMQIEQAVQRVDMDKDIQHLVEQSSTTTEDSKVEFLMADYFEEHSKPLMNKDRRIDAINFKLRRLEDNITKTKKDSEGIENLLKSYADNPTFSNQKNLEETEQLQEEISLKLDLLEATHYKLCQSLYENEGKPKSHHRFSGCIFKWKDKDYEHSVVQLSRPVKLRRTRLRSRLSLRASIIYKGPVQALKQPGKASPEAPEQDKETPKGPPSHKESGDEEQEKQAAALSVGRKCRALYNFTPEHDDELPFREGDLLDILKKEDNGWWFGILGGQIGHFPSAYVEELPVPCSSKSADV